MIETIDRRQRSTGVCWTNRGSGARPYIQKMSLLEVTIIPGQLKLYDERQLSLLEVRYKILRKTKCLPPTIACLVNNALLCRQRSTGVCWTLFEIDISHLANLSMYYIGD